MIKNHKIISLLIVVLLVSAFSLSSKVNATSLTGNELFRVNNFTITKSTKITDINARFGQPKIQTVSAFGGNAYSYYDNAYSYYLYVETNSSGTIKAVGALYGNFVGRIYAQGDTDKMNLYRMAGTTVSDIMTSKVYGMYEYNASYSDLNSYWNTYNSDTKYLFAMQSHGVAATKVINKHRGFDTPQKGVSKEIFDFNINLEKNGSNLADYAKQEKLTNQIKYIRYGLNQQFFESYPNPIAFAAWAEDYYYDEAYEYLYFDIEVTDVKNLNYEYRVMYIDESYMEEKEKVELTAEELSLLNKTQAQFNLFTQHGRALGNNYYVITPKYDKLPLTAGKWTKDARQVATDYINIARVGMGVQLLTLDEDISDSAQHKATLVYYMNNNGMKAGHYPTKPAGVSDAFYKKAQTYMNENLYQGNIQNSIVNALNDITGDPIYCGHRYNLLYPYSTKWGVGSVGDNSFYSQACHKFSGYNNTGIDVVAWPSKGIFPLNLVYNGIGNWTVKFYNNYTTTENTTATVKCLNDGKVYEINAITAAQSNGISYTASGSLFSFKNEGIVYADGDVFEITIHRLFDKKTYKTVDYTYRSVFYTFTEKNIGGTEIVDKKEQEEDKPVYVEDIKIEREKIIVSVNGKMPLKISVVPDNAIVKEILYTSLNDLVATVDDDGNVVGVRTGTTSILIECGSIKKFVTVEVSAELIGDINKDGIVNADDATMLVDLYKKGSWTDAELKSGDMDGNKKLNADDVSLIIDYFKMN